MNVPSRPELSLACFFTQFWRVYFVHRFRTRFAAGHVVTVRVAEEHVATGRAISSLSAAFAITLSFF